MKNLTKIFMAVAVAMFAFACVTDTTEDLGVKVEGQGVTELALSLEESRTHLGEKAEGVYPLYWSEGDAISVNGVASNPLTVGGSDTATFSFAKEVTYPLCVVYPASAVATVEGEETEAPVTAYPVNFLAEQPYTVGTFAPQAAPMYGYGVEAAEGEEQLPTQMQHLTGVLRLAIKGNGEKVTEIKVKAEKGAIAGAFTVDCTTGVLTAQEGASNTVTVTFAEPLVLGAEATPVYLTVPAGEYGTFVITVNTEAHEKMTVKFNSDIKPINAGVVREFSAFTYEANANDSEDVFIIDSKEALIEFARIAGTFYPRTTAKLGADIDMEGIDWTPIEGFTRIFDGNRDAGYEITGLNAPLFGTTSATIKNLNINVNIEIDSSSYYDGTTKAVALGGIACIAEGPISDCTVSGKVAWAKRADSDYSYTFVGGAVGQAKEGASFTNVKNEANISTTKANNTTFLGGIVAMAGIDGGTFSVAVTDCENTGSITVEAKNYAGETNRNSYIGGVVGSTFVDLTITGCKNSGAVTHYDAYTKNCHIGGIYGVQYAIKKVSINNCENTGDIYANTTCRENCYIGGVMGSFSTPKHDGVNLSNLKNSGSITVEGQSIQRSVYIGGVAGNFSNNTDGTTFDVENWYNSGTVTMNAGGNQAKTTYTLYLGGVFGNGTRVSVINFDNAGSVIYGKDSAFTKPSGNADLFIGGVGGYRVTGSAKNCDNSGTIYLRGGNSLHHHQIGGVFGQINTYSADMSNCTNSGTIEAESTFSPKRCRIGGLVGCLYYSIMKDCVNSGSINYNAKETANQIYIGGAVGYTYSSSKGNLVIDNVANSGNITVNKGTADKGNQVCVAGIVGSAQKIYTDASYIKNCTNIGDIEINLPTTFTGVDVGGIIAHHSSITNTNIVFSGHKQHSTIKAIDWTLKDIGTIKGIKDVTALVVANCSAGGNFVFSTEDGVDSDGNPETVDVLTPITTGNWFNYIYAGGAYPISGDNTYGGCSLLETKPVVNVVTTPQPAAK